MNNDTFSTNTSSTELVIPKALRLPLMLLAISNLIVFCVVLGTFLRVLPRGHLEQPTEEDVRAMRNRKAFPAQKPVCRRQAAGRRAKVSVLNIATASDEPASHSSAKW